MLFGKFKTECKTKKQNQKPEPKKKPTKAKQKADKAELPFESDGHQIEQRAERRNGLGKRAQSTDRALLVPLQNEVIDNLQRSVDDQQQQVTEGQTDEKQSGNTAGQERMARTDGKLERR